MEQQESKQTLSGNWKSLLILVCPLGEDLAFVTMDVQTCLHLTTEDGLSRNILIWSMFDVRGERTLLIPDQGSLTCSLSFRIRSGFHVCTVVESQNSLC